MAKATTKRAFANMYLDWDGMTQAVQAMERVFGPDTPKVYNRALDTAMAMPEAVMKDWFEQQHRRTGRTAKAYVDGRTVAKWDQVYEGYGYYREYGYSTNKSEVPLFFEYGTPRRPPYKIEPEFVVYYAIKDFGDVIHREMRRAIVDELKKAGQEVPKEVEYGA